MRKPVTKKQPIPTHRPSKRAAHPDSYGEWRTLEEIKGAVEQQVEILSTILIAQAEIVALLREIVEEVAPPAVPVGLQIVAKLPNGTTSQGDQMPITITDVQSVPLSLVEFKPDPNAGGKTVETPVTSATWDTSNPAVVTLDSQTGVTNTARAVGPDGVATVTATADGFTATIEITVVDSEVGSLTIVPGTPVDPAPAVGAGG
jgi:hypothetical protein